MMHLETYTNYKLINNEKMKRNYFLGTPANFRGKKIIYPNIFIKRNKKKGKSETP